MSRAYLISKYLDPVLGIATGVLAYHLHESNPRTAPPQGDDLRSLIRWKRATARQAELEDLAQWNEMLIIKQLSLPEDIRDPESARPVR